ncbi:TPA: hypothetical protein N0F65_005657 [Lagenidium giganteum]|uniref:Transposase n=1 Tax=Lagenidium giganteum TaxID=4803 RepID=A0AAV2ZE27_9STRA|nr:TPA: hypothetical protein N0F65_005657 [Lagenidium giganteum]
MLDEMAFQYNQALLHCDNKSTIAVVCNESGHHKLPNLDRKVYKIKDYRNERPTCNVG